MQTLAILGLISAVILLGFIGNHIFIKSNIPSIVWLLLVGFLLGQVFNIVDRESLMQMTDIMSSLAIIVILSSGGMELDLIETIKSAPVGFLILIVGILFSVGTAFLIMLLFGFRWELALFTGLTLSGTSSSVVMPIIQKLKKVDQKVKSILAFESIGDTFTIVIALILLDFMSGKMPDISTASFVLPILSGISVGVVVGIIWMFVLEKIKKYEHTYAATLAVLILTYVLTEYTDGSGALACFSAGLAMGNYGLLKKLTEKEDKRKRKIKQDFGTSKYHDLISFFIRTFFFVFVGSIVLIQDYIALLIGIAICVFFFITRYFYINFMLKERKIKDFDKNIMLVMFPRGLSAAVLATVPLTKGIAGSEIIVDIVFTVILGTILISTVGVYVVSNFYSKKKNSNKKETKEKKD